MAAGNPQGQLVQTAWASSWIGNVRPGALDDTRLDRRAGAWAAWALEHAVEVTSRGRDYLALSLDGEFYDPDGRLEGVRPHLEIPQWLTAQRDEAFPQRLALVGNGLRSMWWVPSEVYAVRRTVLARDPVIDGTQLRALESDAAGIRHTVLHQLTTLSHHFSHVSDTLARHPQDLSSLLREDITSEDVTAFWPGAPAGWAARIEPKLAEREGKWLARRATVWVVTGAGWQQPVLLPRLTRRSFLDDPLWSPASESPLALIVRGVISNRLLKITGRSSASVAQATRGHLRAQPARPGASLPRASVESAAGFLAAFASPDEAFEELCKWAQRSGGTLSVEGPAFRAAWLRAIRHIERAEDPARADIDTILPLAWDGKRLVRASWVTS